MVYDNDVMNTL